MQPSLATGVFCGCLVFFASLVGKCSPAQEQSRAGEERLETDRRNEVYPGDADRLLNRLLMPPVVMDQPVARATSARARGIAADVYPQVAPAVLLVRTDVGHGTGFFISNDGWILTNAHVVEGALFDHALNANVVSVTIGEMDEEGWMRIKDQPLTAAVYCVSARQDLALLRVRDGGQDNPYVAIADRGPKPGETCIAIGNPGIGALWSVRQGEVVGEGQFPADHVSAVTRRLQLRGKELQDFEDALKDRVEQMKVLHSNTGISGGDSGGPLVNEQGQLIGVTFAARSAEGVAATVSLHVELSEVRDFVAMRPDNPEPQIPSLYMPVDTPVINVEEDDFGRPALMEFRLSPNSAPLGIQFRLWPQRKKGQEKKSDPRQRIGGRINKLGARRIPDWQPHISIYRLPSTTLVYDLDADGVVDRAYRDESGDGRIDTRYVRHGDSWQITTDAGDPLEDPGFGDRELVDAFQARRAVIRQVLEDWQAEK